jgi:hypothetical protein
VIELPGSSGVPRVIRLVACGTLAAGAVSANLPSHKPGHPSVWISISIVGSFISAQISILTLEHPGKLHLNLRSICAAVRRRRFFPELGVAAPVAAFPFSSSDFVLVTALADWEADVTAEESFVSPLAAACSSLQSSGEFAVLIDSCAST